VQTANGLLRWIESWLHGRLQRVCLDGHSSRWASVLSGIPQGSVLGPLLFLIFVNDIDSNIRSLLLKFADDAKVFEKVNSFADRHQLQDDKLCDWAETWQMEFNVPKCVAMHTGHGNSKFRYSMKGRELAAVASTKDLGVHISDDLKSANHCCESYQKANRMLGLVKRTIKHRHPDMMVWLSCCLKVWLVPISNIVRLSGIWNIIKDFES